MKEGDTLTADMVRNAHFRSYKDRYIIIDNLDCHGEPVIHSLAEIYNTKYTYITVVLRGTMHMIINDHRVEVRANDYIVINPYMSVEIMESRCLYFSFLVQNEIANDIYEHSGIGRSVGVRCFCYHHYHFEKYYIDMLLNDYSLIRIEQERHAYKMKEMTLRAFIAAFLAHLYSFRKDEDEIIVSSNSKQYTVFHKFLTLLSLYCKKERSVQFYADKIGITPKYLSNIVHANTGYSASVVIDCYVVYRIRQVLYANDMNIKTISSTYNFPNQSFFGRYFKRITGMPPNEFLKKNNRKAITD